MITPLTPSDLPWARQLLQQRWGIPVITRGKAYDPTEHPGFIAKDPHGRPLGLATYRLENDECELLTLDSLQSGRGIGLVKAVKDAAQQAGCWRLWLITTNDNTAAMRFYQKIGFHMTAVHRDALAVSRQLKPAIPLTGEDGLPLRDEVEFEIILREIPPPQEPPRFPLRLSRRKVYESEWVRLVLDRVVFPDGRLIPEYHLLHTRDAAAVLVENEAGALLFEYVYRYATSRMEWEIPAGGIEEGEDLLEAARREVYEETGYETSHHRLVYVYNPANGSIDTRFYLVACRAAERSSGIDPGEIHSTRWMQRPEIENLIRQGELQDGFTLSGVLLWWWLAEHSPRS
jgi:8-oxo-dGTP pyrophosphatase MutT (NUDIX family)/GNAT superfamily N-acetyltransferase